MNGIWEWVSDLSPLTFTSWGPNEPNDAKENCAHIHSGKSFNWNDHFCTQKFIFICEKDVVCIFSSVKNHIAIFIRTINTNILNDISYLQVGP